jgi:SpoVK/Ycf46/Vps4 family AAA+-type ATPase
MRYHRNITPPANTRRIGDLGSDERFVVHRVGTALLRLVDRFGLLDEETLNAVVWVLGGGGGTVEKILVEAGRSTGFDVEAVLEGSRWKGRLDAGELVERVSNESPSVRKAVLAGITAHLARRVEALRPRSPSKMERSLESVQRAFELTDTERELLLLLFLCVCWGPVETYFEDHLGCTCLAGWRYLATALGTTPHEVARAASGTLVRMEIIDVHGGRLSVSDAYQAILRDPLRDPLPDGLYRAIPRESLPLDAHEVSPDVVRHIVKLLKARKRTPTHLLLYGQAGAGKTSFARRLAHESGLPPLEVPPDDHDRTTVRRAGIVACLRLKNEGNGVVVVVDEADALLNTQTSWWSRGESQDKAWLNDVLEQPDSRVIWVTNSIDGIEESVMRRFTFSLRFEPFTKRQRVQLWDRVLRRRRVRRFFSASEIAALAARYDVSAGAIDLAVREAASGAKRSKAGVHRAVALALDAHEALRHGGRAPVRKERVDPDYSLEGLNIEGDVGALMKRLRAFDRYLRRPDDPRRLCMNLLFHGPPGTGKSELARHIAERLDRELIVKRASDLLSPWVGETEQSIAAAFRNAERGDAVLVIDEIDSLLYDRAGAVRSWEVSFVNELLAQMERFRGILVATTNRLDALDEASLRRFGEKIGFGFLTPDGTEVFYRKMLSSLAGGRLDDASRNRLRSLTNLAPGDFKVVRDRHAMSESKPSHATLIGDLEAEAAVKQIGKSRRVGF